MEGKFEMKTRRGLQKPKQIVIEIPYESQAAKRLQSISEQTRLSDYELLLKWLNDRDLSNWQKGIEEQLRQISELLGGEMMENKNSEVDSPSKSYRQQLLKKIQDLREQGLTYSKIAARFNAENVATISGTGRWYPNTISQILQKKAT
jgi:hypothetical protein